MSQKDDKSELIDKDATEQFKLILYVIIGVLVLFLFFFVYNLIKCYLPKWTGQQNNDEHESEYNSREKEKERDRRNKYSNKLEFEEI